MFLFILFQKPSMQIKDFIALKKKSMTENCKHYLPILFICLFRHISPSQVFF